MKKHLFFTILIVLSSLNLFSQEEKREFRAAWIATAKMIDYPARKGMTSQELKDEFIETIEFLKKNGINAIIFQVRPAADAFFDSPYEPWSEWLTGKQGQAPDPYFDPLEFMIEETHKRNMEFHAWINPFRAVATIEKADVAENHITNTKPEWFFTYNINKYFDPGIPEVREYLTEVIVDIVKRYDVDGIHFDDYFYPYPKKVEGTNRFMEIPDNKTFNEYGKEYKNVQDWRRDNMNTFIEMVNREIKAEKSWVVFGIGPGGIWRNKSVDEKGSNTRGFATYDWLYADVLKWLDEGWIDYVAPQIYWNIGHKAADYATLVQWWDKNSYEKDVYVGLAIYKIDETRQDPNWGKPQEIPNQIRLARQYENIKGFALYQTKSLKKNPLGICDSLQNNLFSDTVATPLAQIGDTIPPDIPKNMDKFRVGKEFTITWDNPDITNEQPTEPVAYYAVYRFEGREKIDISKTENRMLTTKDTYFRVERDRNFRIFGEKHTFVVTACDRFDNESQPSKSISIRFKRD